MLTVGQFMTDTVFTLQQNDNMLDARHLMSLAKIRHAPVTDDNGNFEGLITDRDVLACTISRLAEIDENIQKEIDSAILVKDIMRTDIMCATVDTDIREAGALLLEHKYGCLPVVKERTLVGIITEADFIKIAIKLLDEKMAL